MSVHAKVWDDEVSGESGAEEVVIPPGDYFIIVTEPATESVQAFANGTHVITVKGRTRPTWSGWPRVQEAQG